MHAQLCVVIAIADFEWTTAINAVTGLCTRGSYSDVIAHPDPRLTTCSCTIAYNKNFTIHQDFHGEFSRSFHLALGFVM